jgi:hypothetical protein
MAIIPYGHGKPISLDPNYDGLGLGLGLGPSYQYYNFPYGYSYPYYSFPYSYGYPYYGYQRYWPGYSYYY